MVEVKKLFYKILFRLFIFNKHKRKKLYICLSKAGIAKYRALAGLSAEEYKSGKKFKYFIAVACIIKNEGPYLKEWLEYHKLIGVEHFYVYDNESTDDTKDILKPYIDSGEVTYIYYPGRDKQDEALCCIKTIICMSLWRRFMIAAKSVCIGLFTAVPGMKKSRTGWFWKILPSMRRNRSLRQSQYLIRGRLWIAGHIICGVAASGLMKITKNLVSVTPLQPIKRR